MQYTAELTRNYRCSSDITRLLSDLMYYDLPIAESMASKEVIPHPKAKFCCVFFCSDCSELIKAIGANPPEHAAFKLDLNPEACDAKALVCQLKYFFTDFPESWKSKYTMKNVCVVSANRKQVIFNFKI